MKKTNTDVRVQGVKTYCWEEGMFHYISTGPSPLHWMWSIFIPYRRLLKCWCFWHTEGIDISGVLKWILLIGIDKWKLVSTLNNTLKSSPEIFTSHRLRRSVDQGFFKCNPPFYLIKDFFILKNTMKMSQWYIFSGSFSLNITSFGLSLVSRLDSLLSFCLAF